MKLSPIFEAITKQFDCSGVIVTQEIADEISKFNSSEELLRAGGISDDALDKAAFGFTKDDIKTLMPNQLKIKWKGDWQGVLWQQREYAKRGMSKVDWAKKINLSEPIDVVYEKGDFYVDDGHHRTYAAKILNKPLNVNLEIRDNPILKLGIPDYDQYHRCAFKKVKGYL